MFLAVQRSEDIAANFYWAELSQCVKNDEILIGVRPMTPCRNLITDVPGLLVGNAQNQHLMSGVTVVRAIAPFIAAVDVRGGGPGTRETDALGLAGTVQEAHAIVLSGGSAFGLSAASGVQNWLVEHGIGFAVRTAKVPIVPQAVLFDLLNGGDKAWGSRSPYEDLGRSAADQAASTFDLGSAGAGFGAATATLRGGLGSASAQVHDGIVIGALAAVNPVGSVTVGNTPHFWAAPFERDQEFGGLGPPGVWPSDASEPKLKGGPAENTTLAVVATNARLEKIQVQRLAVMAQSGLARAIYPVHTPLDGDVVFALATGDIPLRDPIIDLARLGAEAANTLARAVARGVYEASAAPAGWLGPPAWRTHFGFSGPL